MMHIDEGRLQAYLDQELPLDERRRAEKHLAGCEACQRELSGLGALTAHFSGAMAQLDRAPRGRQHAIGWPRQRRSEAIRKMLPRAAVLLLFAGAAASATIPGSPVRDWLSDRDEPAATPAAVASQDEAAAVTAAPLPLEAGVSVEAAEGAVEIVVRDAEDLRVTAILVDGMRAGVYARGGASGSRFQTGAGRIEVINPRGGELRIELPEGAELATVTVNGREYLRKQGGKLDLAVGASDDATGGIEFSVQP